VVDNDGIAPLAWTSLATQLDQTLQRLSEQQRQLPGLTLTPFFDADVVLRLLRNMAKTITMLGSDVSAVRKYFATQTGSEFVHGAQRAVGRLSDSLGEQVGRTGSTLQGQR
jgi:hypothetical protein